MFGMGMGELLVIAVVALLFLGPEKLPEAAKTISKGIRDLRKQTRELTQSIEADEEIGSAIRDIKSALRGDEIRRPPVRKQPPVVTPEPKAGELAAGAAGAAGTVEQAEQAEQPEGADDTPAIKPAATAVARNPLPPTPSTDEPATDSGRSEPVEPPVPDTTVQPDEPGSNPGKAHG